MKKIGLIGGMSWESSKLYYEFINKRVNTILGGSHSGEIIMVSVDFAKIERLSFDNNWGAIGELMSEAALNLEKAGADVIVLCTNTIHIVSDAIRTSTSIPFIHIADATGQAIQKCNLKKVGLLGTAFTMEKEFYKGFINEKYDVDVIVPNDSDRKIVHDIIYNELVKGIFTDASKEKCKEIMERLKQNGAEGIILGCTELPILIPASEIDVPTFDTGKIHAHKAVDWAISKN